MTSPDDKLKAALARNGSVDAEKAEQAKAKAVGAFDARMRRIERIVWIWLIACICIGLFAFMKYKSPSATSTKELVGCAIVMLVAYESTVLLKLAYWTINTKLSVLKEIKRLRMDVLPPSDDEQTLRGRELEAPLRSLSRWERAAWKGALVAIAVLTATYFIPPAYQAYFGHRRHADLNIDSYVTIAADGSVSSIARDASLHAGAGLMPITSFPFDVPSGAKIRWLDDRGRELPFQIETKDDRDRYTVELIDPVMPGEKFQTKRIMESATPATKEGDVWVYWADWGFGPQEFEYHETVVLPKGADLVSSEPKPTRQYTRDGSTILRFEAFRDHGEHFRYTIRYVLSSKSEE